MYKTFLCLGIVLLQVACTTRPDSSLAGPSTPSTRVDRGVAASQATKPILSDEPPSVQRAKSIPFIPGPDPANDPMTPRVKAACGQCHAFPDPREFTRQTWAHANRYMARVFKTFYDQYERQFSDAEIAAYYDKYAAKQVASPTLYPQQSGWALRPVDLGEDARIVVDLQPSRDELRLVDMLTGQILSVNRKGTYRRLAQATHPVTAKLWPSPKDPSRLLVADLGVFRAADTQRGFAAVFGGNGVKLPLLDTQGRVTSVAHGDVDGDGREDIVVGVFGWHKTGGLYVLRQDTDTGPYRSTALSTNAGYMAVEVVAVNGAKRASIFALTAQHHERLERYDFDNGQFSSRILFQASTPLWGGLGMRVVDIDKDGDLDILHWNGDTLDAPKVAPWQGVHLLENTGDTYRRYQLASLPGVHDVALADLDHDGHQDLFAVANLSPHIERTLVDEGAPHSVSFESVLLIQQTKPMGFKVKSLLRDQTCFSSVAVVPWGKDGRPAIALGGFGAGWSLLSHHGDVGLTANETRVCGRQPLMILELGGTPETLVREKSTTAFQGALKRIVSNDPDDARNRVNLGNAYLADRRYRHALRQYEDALNIEPDMPAATVNYALVLDRLGRAQEAVFKLKKLLQSRPKFTDAHAQLATILYRTRAFKEALTHIDTALEKSGQNADLWANRGHILVALDRKEDAAESYKIALKINPAHGRASHYLKRLNEQIKAPKRR